MMPFKILYKSVTGTLYIKHKIVCCLAEKKSTIFGLILPSMLHQAGQLHDQLIQPVYSKREKKGRMFYFYTSW